MAVFCAGTHSPAQWFGRKNVHPEPDEPRRHPTLRLSDLRREDSQTRSLPSHQKSLSGDTAILAFGTWDALRPDEMGSFLGVMKIFVLHPRHQTSSSADASTPSNCGQTDNQHRRPPAAVVLVPSYDFHSFMVAAHNLIFHPFLV